MTENNIKIILEYSGERLTFPINPSELAIDIDSASETLDVIGLGEVSIPRRPKLATLRITSFFWNKTGVTVDDSINVDDYVTWIKAWQLSRKPANFIVVGLSHFTMMVTCEKFRHEKRAGEEGATYFELSLKEYRAHGAQRVYVNQDEFVAAIYAKTPSRVDNLTVPEEVTVTEETGTTNLEALAQSTGTDATELYGENIDSFDTETGEFKDGSVVTIPESTESSSEDVNTASDISLEPPTSDELVEQIQAELDENRLLGPITRGRLSVWSDVISYFADNYHWR